MIQRAPLVWAALSAMLHLGGVVVISDTPRIDLAGAAPGQARLGNSFQDVAEGGQAVVPVPAPAVATSAVATSGNVAAAVLPLTGAAPVAPAIPSVQPSLLIATPVQPSETIAGTEPVPVSAATNETIRPQSRPEPRKVAADPPEIHQRERPATENSTPGGATPERRGVAEGVQDGVAHTTGTSTGSATEAGNAAVSNYPGTIMHKISRTRKPRVGAQGTAIVGFEIAADGSIASAVVLRSSGQQTVDQAALEHLRHAAPFPPPPSGATRRFQVEYVSRG